jgi:putative membrane protein
VTTGLGRKGESNLLLPPAPVSEAHRVSAEVLRQTSGRAGNQTTAGGAGNQTAESPTRTPLRPHPMAALRRRMARAVVPLLVLAAGLAWFAPSWAWQVVLALVPFSAAMGWDRYRSLGHALTDRYLLARSGSAIRETVALQRTGIIGWRISRSFFQRRAGLVTISATTAAGDGAYYVIDVAEADGLALADDAVPGLLRPFLERAPEALDH